MNAVLRLAAPAKLNLRLKVTGRRSDGYHLLESTFVLLELSDTLEVRPGARTLVIDGPLSSGIPAGPANLAWRGLSDALGDGSAAVSLNLHKRIPAAAGLGGGSSDAAAAWRLGRAWAGMPDVPGPQELASLAAIGADVPFFAAATPAATVTGIGETVEPIPPDAHHVVLVHPPFGLATAAVFGELRPEEWGSLENDLLAPARRLRPELDDLFGLITAAGGHPRLTGSGSTIFSLANDEPTATELAERLREDGLRVTVTRTRRAAASIERINGTE